MFAARICKWRHRSLPTKLEHYRITLRKKRHYKNQLLTVDHCWIVRSTGPNTERSHWNTSHALQPTNKTYLNRWLGNKLQRFVIGTAFEHHKKMPRWKTILTDATSIRARVKAAVNYKNFYTSMKCRKQSSIIDFLSNEVFSMCQYTRPRQWWTQALLLSKSSTSLKL
jgi:hypothetical protein